MHVMLDGSQGWGDGFDSSLVIERLTRIELELLAASQDPIMPNLFPTTIVHGTFSVTSWHKIQHDAELIAIV